MSVCLAMLLICAGDVETNPGPKIDDVLALLKECHAETTASLTDISKQITDINARVSSIEQSLTNVSGLKNGFDAVTENVQECKVNIRKTNNELIDVVEDMNNRMRRNNLIIKGLPETEHEGYAESERIAKEFLDTHLGIQVHDIERAHRLGQRHPGKHRPIIVKFLNFKSKTEILNNASKLKDLKSPKVWLDEDFSPKVLHERKKLRDFAKEHRRENERFTVRYNKLHMKSGIYRYDSASDRVIRADARPELTSK